MKNSEQVYFFSVSTTHNYFSIPIFLISVPAPIIRKEEDDTINIILPAFIKHLLLKQKCVITDPISVQCCQCGK